MRHTKAIAAAAAVLIVAGGASGAAAAGAVKSPPSQTATAGAQQAKDAKARQAKDGNAMDAKAKQAKDGKGADWLVRLAHRYGVSVARLERALPDVKREIGQSGKAPTDPAVVALLAHDLGISRAKATQLLKEVFTQPQGGKGKPGGSDRDAFVNGLAKQLKVSHEKAAAAYAALTRLSREPGGVDPRSPQFAAIATNLGVTPKQLADAITAVKLSLSGVDPKVSPASYKG